MAEPTRSTPSRATKPVRADRSGVGALVGSGPSIVGVSGAMRARDVSRPREAHDAAAERDLVVRRRPAAEPPRDQRPATLPGD